VKAVYLNYFTRNNKTLFAIIIMADRDGKKFLKINKYSIGSK